MPAIPVVVSYVSDTPLHDEIFTCALRELAEVTAAALTAAGLDARWVNPTAPHAPPADLLADSRGVIVLGGADVDPALYGQEPAGTHMASVDRAADDYEAELLRTAIAQHLPVFTICRGTQVLNAALGGTLIQHLDGHTHPPGTPMPEHDVSIAESSRLHAILGPAATIRTSHHQAVDRVAEGLVVTAVSPDGIIEAVEGAGEGWLIGVQWHPEAPNADPAGLRALLADFAQACA